MANDVDWIKITTDMFDNKKIKKLRRLPDGNNLVLIWVMLLTIAGKSNAGGMILISDSVPYTAEDLADELDFEITTVRLALEALEHLGMIYRENESVVIANWYEYQSKDGLEKIREQTRKRVADFRERQKTECNVTVTLPVTQSSISISNSISNSSNKEILDSIVTSFNEICVSLPKVTKLSDKRRKKLETRLKTFSVDDFKKAFEKIEESDFASGRSGKWRATFDWILEEGNLIKVLEDNYKNKGGVSGGKYGSREPDIDTSPGAYSGLDFN